MRTTEQRKSSTQKSGYYTRESALFVKALFDGMMTDGKPRLVDPARYGYTQSSMYAYLINGSLYLLDNLDTSDKTYARLKFNTKMHRQPDGKIQVMFKARALMNGGIETLNDNVEVKLTPVLSVDSMEYAHVKSNVRWEETLDNFICGDDNGRLEIKGLSLTPDEQKFIRSSTIGLRGLKIVELSREVIVIEKGLI